MDAAPENNPLYHAQKLKAQMVKLVRHLRADVGKVTEPKAQALFEASAEVLTGVVKALDDYRSKCDAAGRTASVTPRRIQRVTQAKR